MEKHRNKKTALSQTLWGLLSCTVFTLGMVLRAVFSWISEHFGIGFEELVYTLSAPLKGADTSVVLQCILARLSAIFCIAAFIVVYMLFLYGPRWGSLTLRVSAAGLVFSTDLWRWLRRAMALLSGVVLLTSCSYVDRIMGVRPYLRQRQTPTTLYEDYYVDPKTVAITGEGKNLIYIYMESMETTYASQADGGWQPENNYIPNLTKLARENVSFSNSDKLGGFHSISGAMNTVCALFSTTSGVPFQFPVGFSTGTGNRMENYQNFASGITNLGDILAAKGYQNEFLCGSDASFAGRREYFTQHGDYQIFDLFTAREEGYIPEDYYVWWGFEDEILYRIAKDELFSLARSGQPFNLTMLTVDTHHGDGYVCPLCQDEYDSITPNVVSCADRQVTEFIAWCQRQDFYKDTVIVITGDHPRMDNNLADGVAYYDRTIYNCFLNSSLPAQNTNGREFTPTDIFPTTLAAMGFQFEGDRLGVGTNLFSGKSTLCEEMGYDALNEEIGKYSAYYIEHFA